MTDHGFAEFVKLPKEGELVLTYPVSATCDCGFATAAGTLHDTFRELMEHVKAPKKAPRDPSLPGDVPLFEDETDLTEDEFDAAMAAGEEVVIVTERDWGGEA